MKKKYALEAWRLSATGGWGARTNSYERNLPSLHSAFWWVWQWKRPWYIVDCEHSTIYYDGSEEVLNEIQRVLKENSDEYKIPEGTGWNITKEIPIL